MTGRKGMQWDKAAGKTRIGRQGSINIVDEREWDKKREEWLERLEKRRKGQRT